MGVLLNIIPLPRMLCFAGERQLLPWLPGHTRLDLWVSLPPNCLLWKVPPPSGPCHSSACSSFSPGAHTPLPFVLSHIWNHGKFQYGPSLCLERCDLWGTSKQSSDLPAWLSQVSFFFLARTLLETDVSTVPEEGYEWGSLQTHTTSTAQWQWRGWRPLQRNTAGT